MAGSSQTWADFDRFTKDTIPRQTIPILRQFAERVTTVGHVPVNLRSQERKSELVSKVQGGFNIMKARNDTQSYLAVRQACEAIIGPSRFEHRYGQVSAAPPPTFGGVPNIQRNNSGYGGAGAGPSRAGWQSHSQPTAYARASPTLQDWKSSPMWKPVKALTNMDMLPDIASNEDSRLRRERKTHFSLPTDVIEKLNHSKSNPNSTPHYSIRLFCASSDYFRAPSLPITTANQHITNRNVPIEYPSNPDASVDEYAVPFKERGLRGKAGSAPPLDLDKSHKGLIRIAGRMASLVVGHTGPTVGKKKDQSKKFWYQVVFTEITTTEELLVKLTALVPTDVDEAIATMRRRAEEDDDIEFGISTLSLRDPLAGMRITKPIRSSKCTHSQCFDARWWLESNRTHPQFLCPHCNRSLNFDDIICDGYFLSILHAVPDEVDEVVLEPTGEWHTEDNKYASAGWAAAHAPAGAPAPAAPVANGNSTAMKRERSGSADSENAVKRSAIEILSDDSEDEVPLRRAAQTSAPPASSVRQPSTSSAPTVPPVPSTSRPPIQSRPSDADGVIDLTLSSDEEDDEPVRPPPSTTAARLRAHGLLERRSPSSLEYGEIRSNGTRGDDEEGMGSENDDEEDQPPYFRPPGVGGTSRNVVGDWIPTRTTNAEAAAREDRLSGASMSETDEALSVPQQPPVASPLKIHSRPSANGSGPGYTGPSFTSRPMSSGFGSGSGSLSPFAATAAAGPSFTPTNGHGHSSSSFAGPARSGRNALGDRASRESSSSSSSTGRIMLRIDRSKLGPHNVTASSSASGINSPLSLGSLLNSNQATPPVGATSPSLSPSPMTPGMGNSTTTRAMNPQSASIGGGPGGNIGPTFGTFGTTQSIPPPRNAPQFTVRPPTYQDLETPQPSSATSSRDYRESVWYDADENLDELTSSDEFEYE